MPSIVVNNQSYNIDVPMDTPLLWVIREELKLTGTKFGCGRGLCGSCTIHLNGTAIRSCITPVSVATTAGNKLTTIENFDDKNTTKAHPIQERWVINNVPQCGYCQSGQIMSAIALYESQKGKGSMTKENISQLMSGNICRCGTYPRINQSIKEALDEQDPS